MFGRKKEDLSISPESLDAKMAAEKSKAEARKATVEGLQDRGAQRWASFAEKLKNAKNLVMATPEVAKLVGQKASEAGHDVFEKAAQFGRTAEGSVRESAQSMGNEFSSMWASIKSNGGDYLKLQAGRVEKVVDRGVERAADVVDKTSSYIQRKKEEFRKWNEDRKERNRVADLMRESKGIETSIARNRESREQLVKEMELLISRQEQIRSMLGEQNAAAPERAAAAVA